MKKLWLYAGNASIALGLAGTVLVHFIPVYTIMAPLLVVAIGVLVRIDCAVRDV